MYYTFFFVMFNSFLNFTLLSIYKLWPELSYVKKTARLSRGDLNSLLPMPRVWSQEFRWLGTVARTSRQVCLCWLWWKS